MPCIWYQNRPKFYISAYKYIYVLSNFATICFILVRILLFNSLYSFISLAFIKSNWQEFIDLFIVEMKKKIHKYFSFPTDWNRLIYNNRHSQLPHWFPCFRTYTKYAQSVQRGWLPKPFIRIGIGFCHMFRFHIYIMLFSPPFNRFCLLIIQFRIDFACISYWQYCLRIKEWT